MRQVLEYATGCEVDTTDGVRIVDADGGWVLVLPDPAEAITHLWAESRTTEDPAAILERWAVVVEAAGR